MTKLSKYELSYILSQELSKEDIIIFKLSITSKYYNNNANQFTAKVYDVGEHKIDLVDPYTPHEEIYLSDISTFDLNEIEITEIVTAKFNAQIEAYKNIEEDLNESKQTKILKHRILKSRAKRRVRFISP